MIRTFLSLFFFLSFFSAYNQNKAFPGASITNHTSDSVERKWDLRNIGFWSISGTPKGQTDLFPEVSSKSDFGTRSNCALIVWNVIDPLFYDENHNLVPVNIRDDPEALSSFYVNQVWQHQLFPEIGLIYGMPVNLAVFNISFYPHEKGAYNFDVKPTTYSSGIDSSGHLKDPQTRWGGILRNIESLPDISFKNLDFWMMDPFVEDTANNGGYLFFDCGDISEDVINNDILDVETHDDGLDNEDLNRERTMFKSYLDTIAGIYGLNSQAYLKASGDPSGDDYHYFRGSDSDQQKLGILDRYKKFNGTEGNSTNFHVEPYPTFSTQYPNTEDKNWNDTLDTIERYNQYKIKITPADLAVGKNHIRDVRTVTVTFPNSITSSVHWYHFTIPLLEPDTVIGDFHNVGSCSSVRLFLKGFNKETHLRFATLELTFMTKRDFNGFISVYPNPTQGPLTIDFNDNSHRKVFLFDQMGRLVYEQNLNMVNEHKVNIDCSIFSHGLYFLKLVTDQETVVKKVVVD